MPNHDDNLREGPADDFFDLTIPERSDIPLEMIRPLERQPPGAWRVGDRVLAPWEPAFLYAGRIAQLGNQQALIQFDDGDAGWVTLSLVRALAVERGLKVLSRRRMGHLFYAGEVVEARGDEVCIGFEDGHEDEWTTVAALRIPVAQPTGGATPTKVSSHLAFLQQLQPGDRVWAHWNNGAFFAGTVDRIRDREAHIHFDDGDSGWVLLEQTALLEIPVGMRILGRWKMGEQFYPGVVTDIEGDNIHIRYDDGDEEWTRPAALAVLGQPGGPNARPT
jgi:hypothetical protein